MRILFFLVALFSACISFAQPSESDLSVWVNEAIVATYTFDYQDFLNQQKKIAHYFSSKAWIDYSKALEASKLLDTIQKNNFNVSAVAQSTPEIKSVGENLWEAKMPVLVVYKSNTTEQRQNLLVTMVFKSSSPPQGVRGFTIESFQSKAETPSCTCNR